MHVRATVYVGSTDSVCEIKDICDVDSLKKNRIPLGQATNRKMGRNDCKYIGQSAGLRGRW